MAQSKSPQRRGTSSSSSKSASTKRGSNGRARGRASSNASRSRSASATNSRSTGGSTRGGSGNRGKSSTAKRASGSSGNRGNRSTAKRPSGRARSGTQARQARSSNGRGTVESVTDTVSSGAQSTAQGIASAAKRAKTPLIAGGAVIAGLAGAAALNNARSGHRKVLGVKMPRVDGLKKAIPTASALKKVDARDVTGAVSEAARRADKFGRRVSSVANRVQTVSETAGDAVEKPGAASLIRRAFS